MRHIGARAQTMPGIVKYKAADNIVMQLAHIGQVMQNHDDTGSRSHLCLHVRPHLYNKHHFCRQRQPQHGSAGTHRI